MGEDIPEEMQPKESVSAQKTQPMHCQSELMPDTTIYIYTILLFAQTSPY